MVEQIQLGNIPVDVDRKDIKNLHLSVHPPSGRVTVAAPRHMKVETIRVFAVSKLDWIKSHQRKLQAQQRETEREYLDRESHYLWGRRYLLTVRESDTPVRVKIEHKRIVLQVRPGMPLEKRRELLEEWYRHKLRTAADRLIRKWESRLGVSVDRFFVQRMKTRWGSCTPHRNTIRLNTELAKKPKPCLEYLVVHEMLHFLEPTHNERFLALIDHYLPNWRVTRDLLNDLPVRHEDWRY